MFEGQNIHLSPVDGKRLCSFSRKICNQRRLNGYAFCIRHILEDKNSPFKQCPTIKGKKGSEYTLGTFDYDLISTVYILYYFYS